MINNPLKYLKEAAEAFGMHAVIADARSTLYELQQLDITDGKFVAVITRNGSVLLPKEGQSFNGDAIHAVELIIYRKFENDTISSIAETYGEKFTNRLSDSIEQALQFLLSLNCSNEFEVTVNSIDEVINQIAVSMDGVKISLSLRAWAQS
jgi:hypothetical protein